MSDHYILEEDGMTPKKADLVTWAKMFEDHKSRTVAVHKEGDVTVSTVFLGIDHSFGVTGLPVLWETMIFGGKHYDYQARYTSWADAAKGHEKAVKKALLKKVRVHPPNSTLIDVIEKKSPLERLYKKATGE